MTEHDHDWRPLLLCTIAELEPGPAVLYGELLRRARLAASDMVHDCGVAELGRAVGVARRTIYRWAAALAPWVRRGSRARGLWGTSSRWFLSGVPGRPGVPPNRALLAAGVWLRVPRRWWTAPVRAQCALWVSLPTSPWADSARAWAAHVGWSRSTLHRALVWLRSPERFREALERHRSAPLYGRSRSRERDTSGGTARRDGATQQTQNREEALAQCVAPSRPVRENPDDGLPLLWRRCRERLRRRSRSGGVGRQSSAPAPERPEPTGRAPRVD